MKAFQPKATHRISSPDEVKAWLHPERQHIVALLVESARTITSVAKELGVHPANITHHFRKLQASGLIKLVEKRDVGRNVEKYYRAVAQLFEVQPSDGSIDNANTTVLRFLRDDLTSAIHGEAADDLKSALGLIANIPLAPRDFTRFAKKLDSLIQEFMDSGTSGESPYTLNLSLYPNLPPRPPQRIEIRKLKNKGTSS